MLVYDFTNVFFYDTGTAEVRKTAVTIQETERHVRKAELMPMCHLSYGELLRISSQASNRVRLKTTYRVCEKNNRFSNAAVSYLTKMV